MTERKSTEFDRPGGYAMPKGAAPAQREAAEKSKKEAAALFSDPIVTEISKASPFYIAEINHQDYYRLNRRQPYCQLVIAPKLDKLGLKK